MAVQLTRRPGLPNSQQLACGQCVTELIASGEDVEWSLGCASRLCSPECFLEHQDPCTSSNKPLPLFSERWSGGNSPLTRAMLPEGFNVTRPFDIKVSPLIDFFSQKVEKPSGRTSTALKLTLSIMPQIASPSAGLEASPLRSTGTAIHQALQRLAHQRQTVLFRTSVAEFRMVLQRHGRTCLLARSVHGGLFKLLLRRQPTEMDSCACE